MLSSIPKWLPAVSYLASAAVPVSLCYPFHLSNVRCLVMHFLAIVAYGYARVLPSYEDVCGSINMV